MSQTSKKAWWRWSRLNSISDGALLVICLVSILLSGCLPMPYMVYVMLASIVGLLLMFMLEHIRRRYCERADTREAEARNADLLRAGNDAGFHFWYRSDKEHCGSKNVFGLHRPNQKECGVYCLSCLADISGSVYMPSLAELLPGVHGTERMATDLETLDHEIAVMMMRRKTLAEEHQRRIASEGAPPYRVVDVVEPHLNVLEEMNDEQSEEPLFSRRTS